MAIVYDTGMLVAADRRKPRAGIIDARATARRLQRIVPTVVYGQAWRGGPHHAMSIMLKHCVFTPVSKDLAGEAGRLCARAGTSDLVDALVVVIAQHHGNAPIVTSDPQDISRLVQACGAPQIEVYAV